MLEQVQRFNDIAKQIEEIDAVGGDVYVGGFKVSWEAVKQFIYGLDDEELKLLAYSNKPEIPAELEAYAIYLLEAEKAWDNELTMQNSYFNSKKNISMNLQFFGKNNKEETEMNTFNGEIKDLVEGTVGRALIIDQGNEYLVKPYMLEIDPTTGDVSCRKYAPYTLEKEWEGFEYVLYFEEEEEDWVEETFKDPVFGNNEEEEETMNEIVEALLSNYFGEKVELISEEEEKEMENQREVENMLSQYFQEEVSLTSKHEKLVKLHEQTWKESVREPRVKLDVSTKK